MLIALDLSGGPLLSAETQDPCSDAVAETLTCRATVEHLPSQNGRQPRAEYGSNTHFNQNLILARAILPEESHPDIYPKRVKKHLEH